jgi:hypothetical protein
MGTFSLTTNVNRPIADVFAFVAAARHMEAPPTLVTFESREGPTPFRSCYTIEPDGEGSLLTLDADISSAGLPGPLAHLDAIATRAFEHGMRQNLEGLRHLLEGREHPPV